MLLTLCQFQNLEDTDYRRFRFAILREFYIAICGTYIRSLNTISQDSDLVEANVFALAQKCGDLA